MLLHVNCAPTGSTRNCIYLVLSKNDTVPKKCVSFKIQNFEKVKTKN